MAASQLYLWRKDRRWQKFKDIDELVLTGARTVYSSVTGVNSTDILTITGNSLVNGNAVYFQTLVGGSNVTTNTVYRVISKNGNDFQLSTTTGGSAINLGSDITAGVLVYTEDEMLVWSGEYRDTFTPGTVTITFTALAGATTSSNTIEVTGNIIPPQGGNFVAYPPDAAGSPEEAMLFGAPNNISTTISDEYAHTPLRQSALKKSHWRFRQASNATPTYLYAVWMEGDQISNCPPETV